MKSYRDIESSYLDTYHENIDSLSVRRWGHSSSVLNY